MNEITLEQALKIGRKIEYWEPGDRGYDFVGSIKSAVVNVGYTEQKIRPPEWAYTRPSSIVENFVLRLENNGKLLYSKYSKISRGIWRQGIEARPKLSEPQQNIFDFYNEVKQQYQQQRDNSLQRLINDLLE